jgi:hypothetical protein
MCNMCGKVKKKKNYKLICIAHETHRRSNLSVTTMSDRTGSTDLDFCSVCSGFNHELAVG